MAWGAYLGLCSADPDSSRPVGSINETTSHQPIKARTVHSGIRNAAILLWTYGIWEFPGCFVWLGEGGAGNGSRLIEDFLYGLPP